MCHRRAALLKEPSILSFLSRSEQKPCGLVVEHHRCLHLVRRLPWELMTQFTNELGIDTNSSFPIDGVRICAGQNLAFEEAATANEQPRSSALSCASGHVRTLALSTGSATSWWFRRSVKLSLPTKAQKFIAPHSVCVFVTRVARALKAKHYEWNGQSIFLRLLETERHELPVLPTGIHAKISRNYHSKHRLRSRAAYSSRSSGHCRPLGPLRAVAQHCRHDGSAHLGRTGDRKFFFGLDQMRVDEDEGDEGDETRGCDVYGERCGEVKEDRAERWQGRDGPRMVIRNSIYFKSAGPGHQHSAPPCPRPRAQQGGDVEQIRCWRRHTTAIATAITTTAACCPSDLGYHHHHRHH